MKKSSVIRCLTGVYSENVYEIKHLGGKIIRTFTKTSSLQESDLTESDFVNKVTNNIKSKYEDILISLRVNGINKHKKSNRVLNPARDYINYFTSLKWNILKIVYLQDTSKNVSLGNIVPTLTLKTSKNQPANNIAAIIRKNFLWE